QDPNLPITKVSASRGKQTRAEPVSALYENHRAHHVGAHLALEDQMATWVPGEGASPDRVDALVWAVTALAPRMMTVGPPIFTTRTSPWAPVSRRAFAG